MPPERASKAEEAIFFRMQALKGDPGGEDERRAAGDACSGLLALKTDMLQWPRLGVCPRISLRSVEFA